MRPSKEILQKFVSNIRVQPEYIAVMVSAVVGYVSLSVAKEIKARYDTKKKLNNTSRKHQEETAQKAFSTADKPEWFKVLEVPSTASIDEIKIAYRKKIFEYHPDRVASLVQDFKDIAEQKSRLINEAYQVALRLKSREAMLNLSAPHWAPNQARVSEPFQPTPRQPRAKGAKVKVRVP
ncbi:J domain-containing protein [Beijerinckia indica]|uniref:J domain-containing protein n=1 Tax=Beijerinckia indica TaxID=533 RepID=UPI0013051569|nr:J domain-containing protein [Beijerinckia indica]